MSSEVLKIEVLIKIKYTKKNSTRNDNLQKHVVLCGEHESKSETGVRIFAEK